MQSEKNSNTSDRELTISRVFNAPVELVWEAWTDIEHIKNWWGPNGFSNTITKMDMRPGGEWDLVMHGPDGTDYKNKSIFKEIVKYKKIVYEHITGPKFVATIEFEKQQDKTFLKWHMLFESEEEFIRTVKTFKADEGLRQNVEKLKEYLENNKPAQLINDEVVIDRTYNAPVDKVWRAITDKDEMKKWYFDLPDFKPEVGSQFQFYGEGKQGQKFLHLCKITELVKQKKLTYSWRYDGYEGNSFVSFELFPDGNKTKVKLTHKGLESFPVTVHNDFAKENFMEGWTYIIGTGLKNFVEKANN